MYNHKEIEKKWQTFWEQNNTFKTTNNFVKKYYVLDMFPYPSGSGLHVGHPEGYTATDIIARFRRLNSFDVLHPIGWDAFGLPAEQFAIKTRNHPALFTKKNINNFRRQLKSLGFSYDYAKEINTTDPNYYKTTQWIFLQMYKKGLAELRDIDVNWCEELGTVLANEEVLTTETGKKVSERGGFEVVQKPMKQWVLKITKYADQLFSDLDELNWPSSLKTLQKNWIKNKDGSLHLRDWIFSRQRYWGEPFPILRDGDDILLVDTLPVTLPQLDEIKPSGNGESPLANAKEWLFVEHQGKTWRRETNTMPQWAGSSWYYLAYILKNEDGTYLDIDSKEAQERFKKWLPVDLYIGGQEHATLHLLYARFWHKVLYDIGIVPTREPFFKVINQGMILGTDGQKMSKSKGNVINPDDIVEEYGADTLRVYEMFMGPLEETKEWKVSSIQGIRKWLDRVERLFRSAINDQQLFNPKGQNNLNIVSETNKLIKEVTNNIKNLKFNITISKMMVFINEMYKEKEHSSLQPFESFAIILSLFAPHLAEELLQMIGAKDISKHLWPKWNENTIKKEKTIISVQVNGKLRATIEIEKNETKEQSIAKAKNNGNIKKFIIDKEIIQTIFVPNKIINFVIK